MRDWTFVCSHMPIYFSLGETHNRSSNFLFSCPVVGVKFLAHSCSIIAMAGSTWRTESLELLCAITPDQAEVFAYAGCWLALEACSDC